MLILGRAVSRSVNHTLALQIIHNVLRQLSIHLDGIQTGLEAVDSQPLGHPR